MRGRHTKFQAKWQRAKDSTRVCRIRIRVLAQDGLCNTKGMIQHGTVYAVRFPLLSK